MDFLTRAQRSAVMRSVKSTGTRPEETLAVALDALGLKSVRNDERTLGRPDFSFPDRRVAVFVDGAFWHGAGSAGLPFRWKRHLRKNRRRDGFVNAGLRRTGWVVLRFTERDALRDPAGCARVVKEALSHPNPFKPECPSLASWS